MQQSLDRRMHVSLHNSKLRLSLAINYFYKWTCRHLCPLQLCFLDPFHWLKGQPEGLFIVLNSFITTSIPYSWEPHLFHLFWNDYLWVKVNPPPRETESKKKMICTHQNTWGSTVWRCPNGRNCVTSPLMQPLSTENKPQRKGSFSASSSSVCTVLINSTINITHVVGNFPGQISCILGSLIRTATHSD